MLGPRDLNEIPLHTTSTRNNKKRPNSELMVKQYKTSLEKKHIYIFSTVKVPHVIDILKDQNFW